MNDSIKCENNKCDNKNSLLPNSYLGKIDHIFGDFFSDTPFNFFNHNHHRKLKINILEDEKAYYIEALLAGFKKENVKLSCEHNLLLIEAKKEEKKESNKEYRCIECYCGSRQRSFQLPENADADKIDAEMQDGMLKITIQKKKEENHSKESGITIR